MPDLFLEFGSDLLLTANGDIAMAEGWDEIRQRIERRILTNPAIEQSNGTLTPGDYIFDGDYGLGASTAIGYTFTPAVIQAFMQRIYQGVLTDVGVNTNVPPVITVIQQSPQQVQFNIAVTLASGAQNTILLSLP